MAVDFFTSSWGPCWIVLIVIVGIEIAAKRKTRWSVSTRGRVTGSLHDALRGATYLSVPPLPVRAKAHHYCSRRYAISKFMPPHHKHSAQANTEDKKRTTISDTCYFINIIGGIRHRDTLVNRLHDSQRNCCTYRQWCGWAEGISNGGGNRHPGAMEADTERVSSSIFSATRTICDSPTTMYFVPLLITIN